MDTSIGQPMVGERKNECQGMTIAHTIPRRRVFANLFPNQRADPATWPCRISDPERAPVCVSPAITPRFHRWWMGTQTLQVPTRRL